ncbi:hypothetical protein JMF97_28800 [Micromonospora fiedleri]|uniref:Thymidylate kinase n=1 Tax=Micromonospora fiedleri TaxID=1157498 RepID=A0ABS1UV09_9ACTN|nr:hypothetical protein [Micromonospora fiedleri]MBL6280168.1 hypothetical protein [Micromonospora fiedleri]
MTTSAPTHPHETAPVIVAVEGLCYSGKSTLVRHLAPRLDAIIAPEYTDLAPLPPWPPTDHTQVNTALRQLLDLERHRTRHVRTRIAARTHATGSRRSHVVLLDRSPLTLIAHEYGMQALGVPADPSGAATLYADAAAAGQILTPSAYLYLSIPEPVTDTRRTARGPVANHLDDPAVRARIDQTCRTWLRLLPPRRQLILDGTVPPALLATAAAAFIRSLAGPPVPSWRLLAEAGVPA